MSENNSMVVRQLSAIVKNKLFLGTPSHRSYEEIIELCFRGKWPTGMAIVEAMVICWPAIPGSYKDWLRRRNSTQFLETSAKVGLKRFTCFFLHARPRIGEGGASDCAHGEPAAWIIRRVLVDV